MVRKQKTQKKTLPGQHYDVATKVLMDKAAGPMLETFLGIHATDIELIDELPQESASLKRSDYILRVIDTEGAARIVLWEFLSQWKRNAILNLCDYTVLAGFKGKDLLRQIVESRRELMIQSYADDIIKQEGIQLERLQSRRKAICAVLETRFELVPENVLDRINHIETVQLLEKLLRKAVEVKDLTTFSKPIEPPEAQSVHHNDHDPIHYQ